MSLETSGFNKPEKKNKKETFETVKSCLERKESLAGKDLSDLDLTDLPLADQDFSGCDVRGMILDQGDQEVRTDIRRARFVDANFAALNHTIFFNVEAEGAVFSFSQTLKDRRERIREIEALGERAKAEDTGMFSGFNGRYGNFQRTAWTNIDFAGHTGHEALFEQADLLGAIFDGCDLSGIDLSESRIDGLEIKNPVSVKGLKINQTQIDHLIKALNLSNQEDLDRLEVKIIHRDDL